MSSIVISNTNPIALVAVVTAGSSGYTVTLEYDVPPDETVHDITDSFETMPSTVTVNVTSTTVPSGYFLAASGDGTWTSISASSISGVFTVVESDQETFDFSVSATDGTSRIARADPRLIIKKIHSEG